MAIFLETERLILRNVQMKDVDVMYDYRNNHICARYQRGQTQDYAGIGSLVERHKADILSVEDNCLMAVALKNTDEMVGEIVVMPCDGVISLGYTFSYRHHRRGYAFEALSALTDALHQRFPAWEFICFTDRENHPSMALLEKLGYRNMGYVPSKDSQVYGKWISPMTAAEIAAAVNQERHIIQGDFENEKTGSPFDFLCADDSLCPGGIHESRSDYTDGSCGKNSDYTLHTQ